MAESRLNIISISEKDLLSQHPPYPIPSRIARKQELQAKFERLWLLNPNQFNPLRNCKEKERLERTWSLLKAHVDPSDKLIADIGCGSGVFTRRLRDAGGRLEAVDIAENALKYLKMENMDRIQAKQDAMPFTSLSDQTYDVVICTEVIAELDPRDFRLFFSELARLIKANGYVICSSPIDIDSEGGVNRLLELAQTEFIIPECVPSYHALHIRLKKLLEVPLIYVNAWKHPELRMNELRDRSGMSKLWFRLNTTYFLIWTWVMLSWICSPLLSLLKNSRFLLIMLEKICQFFWDQAGISHLIFIGQRKGLQMETPDITPVERPRRKEIWT